MSSKRPQAKPKTTNGKWSDRLRSSSPSNSSDTDEHSAAGQPSEGGQFTLNELGENLQPRIKEALCSEEVLEKIKAVIMEAVMQQVTQDVYEAVSLDIAGLRREQDLLKGNIEKMEKTLTNLRTSLDDQEQYSRRECLRFFGVPENPSENTDDLIRDLAGKQLNLHLNENDIARSHRITPRFGRKGEGPNPIIVRFTTYNIRRRVFEAKAKLKGSNVFIQEDLTPLRRELLNKARKMPTVKRVRTSDGRITAWRSSPNGSEKRVVIRNNDDLAHLE